MHLVAYVHYYASHVRAGSETFLHELLLPFTKNGHTASVVCTEHPGEKYHTVFEGVNVYSLEDEASAVETTRSLHPDVIVTHHQEQATAAKVARDLDVPSIQLIHNSLRVTEKLLRTEHALTVYCSLTSQARFLKNTASNCVINPVCWQHKHRPESLGDMITQVNLSQAKGVRTFSEVVGRLPDHKFLGVQGGYGTQEFHMFSNVEYTPTTFDMKNDVWARTRVFMFPTEHEEGGMTGVEAMMAGVPVIVTPTPAIREAYGFGAIYVDDKDVNGWVEAIRSLDDPVEWEKRHQLALRQAGFRDPTLQLETWVQIVEELASVRRDDARKWWATHGPTRFGAVLGVQRMGR